MADDRRSLIRRARELADVRVVRFLLTGGTVAAYMFVSFAVLYELVGLAAQAALALGFASGVALHFALNRKWVFVHHEGYALRLSRQGARYVVVAVGAYAFTAASLALFSNGLGLPPLPVYYATAAVQATVTFVVFGRWVFRPDRDVQAGLVGMATERVVRS